MRGPSVNEERCAAALFYYPAITAHRCLQIGNGVYCCPGGTVCL